LKPVTPDDSRNSASIELLVLSAGGGSAVVTDIVPPVTEPGTIVSTNLLFTAWFDAVILL
jgi:hypothetical protein